MTVTSLPPWCSPEASTAYRGLPVEIVKFFETGVPPVDPAGTLEIMVFMEAAELSKARGGAPVALAEVTGRNK